jgi:hypothetical protein
MPVEVPADGDFGAAFGAARLGLMAADGADPLRSARRPSRSGTFTNRTAISNRRWRRLCALPVPISSHQGSHGMSTGFFGDVTKIPYEGPESTNPLAFRFYDPDEMVMGKRMEDHCASRSPIGIPSHGRVSIRSAADIRAAVVPGRHDGTQRS